MAIIETIIAQHAEEAAFLWLLRDAAVAAPHYSLRDLAELDARVEAHLDGLRIGGDEAWPFCAEGLQYRESGEVFAAGVIALGGEDGKRIEDVYAVVEAAPETARGLVSAIGWLSRGKLQGKVAGLLASGSPLWRRVGIAACAVHRVDCGKHLTTALQDPDPELRARALRTAGEVARLDLLPEIRRQLTSDDQACAFWAARSAVLLGDRGGGPAALKAIAHSASPFADRALLMLMPIIPPAEAQHWLKALAQDPNRQRHLIAAIGAIGDPLYAPWLIRQMAMAPAHSRIAGESFSFITGVDIAYEDLEGEWPEGFEAGPTESPEDENVALDPDEDLPWPDPDRIQTWWDANGHRFTSRKRYLVGEPIAEEHCKRILRTGQQRQRAASALELALMNPKSPLF